MGNKVEYHPTIKELPASERPRERLKLYGASSLSTAELLAIILRTGVEGESVLALATRLLARYGGLTGLAEADFSDLCAEKGVGEAKAAQLKAAFELGKRLLVASPQERPVIRSPYDAANLLLLEMGFLPKEHLRTILLDTKNRVISIPTICVGALNMASARIGEIFREAIKADASAIILVHNHPSGDPSPSPEDIALTRQVVQAGKLLDIEVLDHIIIGKQRFISLKEKNLGFEAF
ncbi:MAG: DNA repair protein RadC [Anaerolineae bacterium]|nr:DNA repair protein RadC [Anaerolineae bacterium]MDW8102070.1 DNA repair protein RadC [Anaerolineae bacterium]